MLDMTPYAFQTKKRYIYQLPAVISHLGSYEKDQRHYITLLKIFGRWIRFIDSEAAGKRGRTQGGREAKEENTRWEGSAGEEVGRKRRRRGGREAKEENTRWEGSAGEEVGGKRGRRGGREAREKRWEGSAGEEVGRKRGRTRGGQEPKKKRNRRRNGNDFRLTIVR
jgi:hypothetical protein